MVVVLCLALPLLLLPCAKWVWFSNSWGWADCLLLIREFWVGQFVLSLVSLDHILLFCLKVFFFFFCYHANRHSIKQSNRLPLKESTKLTYTTSSTQNEIRTQPRKKHPAQLKDLWIPLSLVLEDLWILSSLALSICISKTNKHCQAPSLLKLKKIRHSDDPSTLKTTNAIKEHYMKQNPQ